MPAGLNAITAGIGWFAVNSVSGTFALNTLTHLPKSLCLVIIVVAQVVIAFFGHNLVQAFERYAFPVLAIIFVIATIVILTKSSPGAASTAAGRRVPAHRRRGLRLRGRAGTPTRPTTPATSRPTRARRRSPCGPGSACSCPAWSSRWPAPRPPRCQRGAALGDPTGSFTGHLPTVLADLTLLAIALGAVAANVLNIYSGALSFVAMGIKLPLALRRAIVALVFGVIGFIVALTGLHDAGTKYENFLLIIAYWIAPWLAVVFCDQWLRRRGQYDENLLFDTGYTNWAGPVAMIVGMGVSIWLFSNQTEYVGWSPRHHPSVGDLTFEVGFVITAVIYLTWHYFSRVGNPAHQRG